MDGMGEIEIEDLVREADLDNLLSETKCRGVVGAHVYTYVANLPRMASAYADDEAEYKRFLQAVHLYQRELSRIVEMSTSSTLCGFNFRVRSCTHFFTGRSRTPGGWLSWHCFCSSC